MTINETPFHAPNRHGSDSNRTIWSCAKTGFASPTAVITNQGTTSSVASYPDDLAATDQYLYWQLPYVDASSTHLLFRCDLSNCPATKTILVSYRGASPNVAMAIDATNVYFANGPSPGLSTPAYDSIYSIPHAGGASTKVVSGGTRIDQLTMTTNGLFWSDAGVVNGPGFSSPCALPSCDPVQTTSKAFVGGGQVVFSQSTASATSIVSCPVGGCGPSPLTLVSGYLMGIDNASFYFLATCAGGARCTERCPISGCPAQPETVPSSFMDASYFYAFTNGAPGGPSGSYGLWRITK